MLAISKYNITINGNHYKKGEKYEIEKQVIIDDKEYFTLIGDVKSKKQKDVKKSQEVQEQNNEQDSEVKDLGVDNFDALEK